MPHNDTLHIDLVKLADLAHTGVRRAALFLGLGLNAAHRPDFLDYELHKLASVSGQTELPMDLFPSNLPPEKVMDFKREFSVWVIACGLREILEHYSILLDSIHNYGLQILSVNRTLGTVDPVKVHKKFCHYGGFKEKFLVLQERFGITPLHSDKVANFYLARNSLTHSLGVVTERNASNANCLVLSWDALEFAAIGSETGLERPLLDLMGAKTSEETKIILRKVNRKREFPIGEKVNLNQQDLWEICWFFAAVIIDETVKSFADFVQQTIPAGSSSTP